MRVGARTEAVESKASQVSMLPNPSPSPSCSPNPNPSPNPSPSPSPTLDQVSMFLVKAEKAIAAKVSADELERVARQHEAELEELSARLLAQMALVHTKVA